MKKTAFIFIFLCFCIFKIQAQNEIKIQYTFSVLDGDTIFNGYIPELTIFKPLVFKSEKEEMEYNKLVRDIKRTLPYAKLVSQSIIESYEFMQTLPDEKAKQKHLESVEKFMMSEYKPKLKKLSRSQGQLLIKLIDRECNTSSYNIVKSLMGSFKAVTYNAFAGLFGNSLKAKYDPNGKDKMIERIVILIEQGVI